MESRHRIEAAVRADSGANMGPSANMGPFANMNLFGNMGPSAKTSTTRRRGPRIAPKANILSSKNVTHKKRGPKIAPRAASKIENKNVTENDNPMSSYQQIIQAILEECGKINLIYS